MFKIDHITKYNFSEAPVHSVQRLNLTPVRSESQNVQNWQVTIEGGEIILSSRDHHGNLFHLAAQQTKTSEIRISASGEVKTTDNFGVVGPHDNLLPLQLFRHETRLCKFGPHIRQIEAALPKKTDELAFLHETSAVILGAVKYEKAQTTVETDAENAAALGAGVCQDHVHIFLTLVRRQGLAARYVSGYLVEPSSSGHQATHAWAEAYIDGLGWVGFDISNGISPNENYVKLATGFDYADAQPVSGMRYGEGTEEMSTVVSVQ